MSTASGIEFLSQGEALGVEVGRIENELGAVWRDASRGDDDRTEGRSPIARAARWNILIPTRGSTALTQAKTMIGAITPKIPARTIVIGRNDASRSQDIHSAIASNVVSRSDGAREVRSEEITLTGRSRTDGHFGALVRALRIPSLPTATFSIDSAVMDGLVTRELLPLSDRLVIDTGRCEHPDELAVLDRLTTDGVRELSDLGWARLSGVRLLFKAMFDPPVGNQPLREATHVTIEHHPRHAASGLLLGAWLAGHLGWTPIDAKRLWDGELRFRFMPPASDARRSGIDLCLRAADDECGPSGIIAIELRSISEPKTKARIAAGAANLAAIIRESVYSVRCTSHDQAEISTPTTVPRSVKIDSRSDIDICVRALGPSGRDPLLREVLAYAARLADRLAERTEKNSGRSRSWLASDV